MTLPLCLPGILVGMILCFAQGDGESAPPSLRLQHPGETQTLPSAIYTFTQVPDGDAGAMRLTLVSIAISSRPWSPRNGSRGLSHADRRRMNPVIEIAVRHRLGAFTLDAAFESDGRLTALFGRSGSGKTSLVNIVAGLIAPESGRVVIDGQVLLDTQAGIAMPRHRRRIGYVFQEARLFPHLSVRQNLLFGRWFSRPDARATSDLDAVLDLLGIAHLLERRPGELSGGEKQRVAIGRALLSKPRLLLMDEPLASLDEARKAEILPYIERLRDEANVPIVYVSHSLSEVVRLATTLVRLDQGRVTACGPTGR